MIPEVVFRARISVGSVYVSGKLPTHRTPPATHVSVLKSHVGEKHGLGVGWVGSFENGFLVFHFLFNILNFVAFLLAI